jgi:aldehyde:ferredoxin oxidoreductase
LDRGKWNEALTRYYELRGWDAKSGHPTKGKLEVLGMKNIADKLALPAA